MKIVSLILGIYAIINLGLIMLCTYGKMPMEYLIFGVFYAAVHLTYQIIRGEGLFQRSKKKM
jgi:hypothetical protein